MTTKKPLETHGDCQQAEATGIIYKIANTLNGKAYVGQTRQPLEMRMKQHKVSKKIPLSTPLFANTAGKISRSKFSKLAPSTSSMSAKIFFIAALNTKTPNGYNLTDGGDACKNFRRSKSILGTKKKSLETRGDS